MCRKISAHVDGGLSGGSRVRRPGSEDPHRRERKFIIIIQSDYNTKRPGFGLGFCKALGLAKSNTEEMLKLVIKIHLEKNFCRLIEELLARIVDGDSNHFLCTGNGAASKVPTFLLQFFKRNHCLFLPLFVFNMFQSLASQQKI